MIPLFSWWTCKAPHGGRIGCSCKQGRGLRRAVLSINVSAVLNERQKRAVWVWLPVHFTPLNRLIAASVCPDSLTRSQTWGGITAQNVSVAECFPPEIDLWGSRWPKALSSFLFNPRHWKHSIALWHLYIPNQQRGCDMKRYLMHVMRTRRGGCSSCKCSQHVIRPDCSKSLAMQTDDNSCRENFYLLRGKSHLLVLAWACMCWLAAEVVRALVMAPSHPAEWWVLSVLQHGKWVWKLAGKLLPQLTLGWEELGVSSVSLPALVSSDSLRQAQ